MRLGGGGCFLTEMSVFPVENGFGWYGSGFVGSIELWANRVFDERLVELRINSVEVLWLLRLPVGFVS